MGFGTQNLTIIENENAQFIPSIGGKSYTELFQFFDHPAQNHPPRQSSFQGPERLNRAKDELCPWFAQGKLGMILLDVQTGPRAALDKH